MITEIPLNPQRGEVWFWLNLALIDDIPGIYALVKALGFNPRIAYRKIQGDIEVCLLLFCGKFPDMVEPPNELYSREQQILADAIDPDAIHFSCCLAKSVA